MVLIEFMLVLGAALVVGEGWTAPKSFSSMAPLCWFVGSGPHVD